MSTLVERFEAALRLVKEDPTVDRLLLLEQVVWPTVRLQQTESRYGRTVSEVELEQMKRLAAQGLTHAQIAEETGRPRSTISWVLSPNGRAPTDRAVTV